MAYQVEIIIGSEKSDTLPILDSGMLVVFKKVGVSWRLYVNSAHRHPDALRRHCLDCIKEGVQVFIGVAGRAAALPGAIVSHIDGSYIREPIPVLGVALSSKEFPDAQDAIYSITRTPQDIPIAFMGVDKSGLMKAAIFACQIIAIADKTVGGYTAQYIETLRRKKEPKEVTKSE